MRIQALAALALALSCTAADAQQPGQLQAATPECSDDRGTDRCSAEQHRRVLALYGLEPIERLRGDGAQVRRVFYVDGNGRDAAAITFERRPERDPMMFVHFPRQGGARPRPQMEAQVPEAVWWDIVNGSEDFERDLAPLPEGDSGVCLHSWVYTVEAADPTRGRELASARRKTQSACGGGLAGRYARHVYDLAVPLLPHCAALDADRHRNSVALLQACSLLSGDRSAAALAMNAAQALRNIGEPDELSRVRDAFDPNATLIWASERHGGSFAAARAWFAGVMAVRPTHFYIEGVHGLSANRARLIGRLWRSESADGNSSGSNQHATVEQIWSRASGEWKLENATVGPFTATESH